MGSRRMARELALQTLYSAEMNEGQTDEALGDVAGWRKYTREAVEYATTITRSVWQHQEDCVCLIRKHATNWDFSRIALIDRIILKMGICELLYIDDVPSRVAIDEAIELAKKYSTEKSGGFINGILDSILRKENPEKQITEKE